MAVDEADEARELREQLQATKDELGRVRAQRAEMERRRDAARAKHDAEIRAARVRRAAGLDEIDRRRAEAAARKAAGTE